MRIPPHALRTPAIRHDPNHRAELQTRLTTPMRTARVTTGFQQNCGGGTGG